MAEAQSADASAQNSALEGDVRGEDQRGPSGTAAASAQAVKQDILSPGPRDLAPDNCLKLSPLGINELPTHPALAELQTTTPTLEDFVKRYVDSGLDIAEHISTSFTKKGKKGDAQLYAKTINGDAWYARISEHKNAKEKGTASFEEFDFGLRVDHSLHEKDYTPDIFDANEVLKWKQEELEFILPGWSEVQMSIWEMYHTIEPSFINNRVFTTLVLSAKRDNEFIVVQNPVNLSRFPDNVKARSHRSFDGPLTWTGGKEKQKLTMGEYVSIERVKLLVTDRVLWEMATASDAKGSIPMSLQKMAIGGKIAKDVPLLLSWIPKHRS